MSVFKFLVFGIALMSALVGCSDSHDELKVLGNQSFAADTWKAATQEARGKMLHSFIIQHDLEGLTAKEIRDLLGPSTGYYDYDEFPAYMIGPKTVQSEYGRGYMLAFPIDRVTRRAEGYVLIPEL